MFTFIETMDENNHDVLFSIDKENRVKRVVRSEFYIAPAPPLEGSVDLPQELCCKIGFYVFLIYLCSKQFDKAFKYISLNKYMIHRIYYGVYGYSDMPWHIKLHRLSRTFNLIEAIHEEFMMDQVVAFNYPVLIMDYDEDFVVRKNTPIYPWNFRAEISVVEVAGFNQFGRQLHMGPTFIDRAVLSNCTFKNGLTHCTDFTFPFLHLMPMDNLCSLNVFNHEETYYHFSRFSMLLKAIYGKYMRVFYYDKVKPQIINEETIFELRQYSFLDMPRTDRRK